MNRLLFSLALTCSCIGYASAIDPAWISLRKGSITLRGTDRFDIQAIPLILKDVKVSDISPLQGAKSISLNDYLGAEFLKAVEVTILQENGSPYLRVKVDLKVLRDPGTYECVIEFITGKEKKELSFSMIRPAARIESTGKIKIEVEHPFFIAGQSEIVKGRRFLVKETTGLSWVSEPKYLMPILTDHNRDGMLKAAADTAAIAAGGTGHGTFEIDQKILDEVDFGKHAGKMDVRAREVTALVPLDIELWYHAHIGWAYVVTVVGMSLGFFLRVFLKKSLDISRVKLKGYNQIKIIEDELISIEDQVFNSNVRQKISLLKVKLDDLIDPLSGRALTPDQLDTAISALLTGYDTEKANLNTRLSTLSANLTIVAGLYSAKTLTHFDQAGLEEFLQAKAFNERRDASRGEEKYAIMFQKLTSYVDVRYSHLRHIVRYLKDTEAFPMSTIESRAVSRIALMKKFVGDGNVDEKLQTITTVERIDRKIIAIDELYESLTAVVRDLISYESHAIDEMRSLNEIDDNGKAVLSEAFGRWQVELSTLASLPTRPFEGRTFSALFEAKKFNTIALDTWKPASQGYRAAKSTQENLDEPSPDYRKTKEITEIQIIPAKTGKTTTVTTESKINGLRRLITIGMVVQFILVGVLMAVAINFIYAQNFIGDMKQLAVIGFSAFGLDVSVDGLNSLRTKLGAG